MKKEYLLIVSMVVLLLVSCLQKETKTKSIVEKVTDSITYVLDTELLRENYTEIKGYFPSDGYISTPELAVQFAYVILSSIYGEKEIENQKPFSVNLDDEVWVIEGDLNDSIEGGSAYIEIDKKTGAILKLLHTK